MKQTKTLGSGFPLNTLIQDLRGAQFLLANEAANEIESLRQKLAESNAEIERLRSIESIAREYGIIGFVDIEQIHNQLAASQAREQQLVKHITRFILEWDNSGSSGAWPVEALKHLRFAIKENQ